MTRKLFAVALVLVCAAAVSVLYHYAVRIPADTRTEQDLRREQVNLESSRRCRDDGTRFVSEFMQAMSDPSTRLIWDEPEFHFSRKLNTCLVHIRYIRERSNGYSFQYNRVVNVYGNSPVLYGEFTRDLTVEPPKETTLDTGQANVPNYTSTRYLQEKQRLFSE
jgi:hypothetical protein